MGVHSGGEGLQHFGLPYQNWYKSHLTLTELLSCHVQSGQLSPYSGVGSVTKVIFNRQFASVFNSSNGTLQCPPDSAVCLCVPISVGCILAFNQRLHPSCHSQLRLRHYSDNLPAANITHSS